MGRRQEEIPIDISDDASVETYAVPNFFGKHLECHIKNPQLIKGNVYSADPESKVWEATEREFKSQKLAIGLTFSRPAIDWGGENFWADGSYALIQAYYPFKAIVASNGFTLGGDGKIYKRSSVFAGDPVKVRVFDVGVSEKIISFGAKKDDEFYFVTADSTGYQQLGNKLTSFGKGYVAATNNGLVKASDVKIVKIGGEYYPYLPSTERKTLQVIQRVANLPTYIPVRGFHKAGQALKEWLDSKGYEIQLDCWHGTPPPGEPKCGGFLPPPSFHRIKVNANFSLPTPPKTVEFDPISGTILAPTKQLADGVNAIQQLLECPEEDKNKVFIMGSFNAAYEYNGVCCSMNKETLAGFLTTTNKMTSVKVSKIMINE